MKNKLFIALFLFLPFGSLGAGAQEPYEMPRTEVVPIADSQNGWAYELYIRLPDGYAENPDQTYPVIYSTDAVWHMEMLAGATEYLMPEVIVVGISWQVDHEDERPYVSRFRDYSVMPHDNEEFQAQYHFGGAADHLAFIQNDVIPLIERSYRADPENRAYFGYSMGGLFGTYILASAPETFHHYVLGSPAVDPQENDLFRDISAGQENLGANVFISIGELETDVMAATEDLVLVFGGKDQAGFTFSGLQIIEDSDHGTAFPPTVIESIRWLSTLKTDEN